MKSLALLLQVLLLCLTSATVALAVEPDEVLNDPVLEQRARAISAELRCMVCQNQSIDDSNAELARDLRLLVRERLVAGDTDEEVFDYVVSRYGEFVLLKPRFSLKTLALWGAPVIVMVIGIAAIAAFLKNRAPLADGGRLSAQEESALAKVLRERARRG